MASVKKALRLTHDAGVGEDGKQKTRSKTYYGVRVEATNENMQQVAEALNTLSEKEVIYVEAITTERLA